MVEIKNVRDELFRQLSHCDRRVEDIDFIALRIGHVPPGGGTVTLLSTEEPTLSWIQNSLNVEYTDHDGERRLFGVVAFKDGGALERYHDEDGTGWWCYNLPPKDFTQVCNALRRGEG